MQQVTCKILRVSLALLGCILLTACEGKPVIERWIGTYAFRGDSPEFPLYMELTIHNGSVTGKAFDGGMSEAKIIGTLTKNNYSLQLHPLKHGSDSSQDVNYIGVRTGNSISGEWVHTIGAKGPWRSSITTMPAKEAMRPYLLPCDNPCAKKGNSSA